MARRIEEINASLADREKRIVELEAMFARPDQFDEPDQIAASGKQYRALKKEAQSLWEEWERLFVGGREHRQPVSGNYDRLTRRLPLRWCLGTRNNTCSREGGARGKQSPGIFN